MSAAERGFSKILVRAVDTYVAVLAVATVQELGMSEIWIAFGTGKHLRYVPAYDISASLGHRKSLALPVIHVSQVVTRYLTLHMLARKLRGKCGRHTTMLLCTAFCELRGAPDEMSDDVYSLWSGSPYSCMTEPEHRYP